MSLPGYKPILHHRPMTTMLLSWQLTLLFLLTLDPSVHVSCTRAVEAPFGNNFDIEQNIITPGNDTSSVPVNLHVPLPCILYIMNHVGLQVSTPANKNI
jgi:hypothetical protein